MEKFEEKHSILSNDDLCDGADFICEFSEELKKYPTRLATSSDETKCARTIRNRLHDETDAKTRLEAFGMHRITGKSALPFFGMWYAVCYVFYFVSFVDNKLAGTLLSLLALLLLLAGGVIFTLVYLGNPFFGKSLLGKVSYNVVSEFCKNDKDIRRTIVVCSSHDAEPGSPVKDDFGFFRKIALIVAPVSVCIFVLFCILKMAIGIDGDNVAGKISAFTIFPFISGIFGIGSMFLPYSPKEKYSRVPNGVSTAVAMATFAYFAEQPELMADGTKIVYASFGGENAGHSGSRAFVKAHPEFAGATVLCIGDVNGPIFKVVEQDSLRKIKYNQDLVTSAHSSAIEQGISLSTLEQDGVVNKMSCLHGFMSNAFANSSIKTATIFAKESPKSQRPSRKDIEDIFSLSVGIVTKWMAQCANDEDGDEKDAPPVEIQIKKIESI